MYYISEERGGNFILNKEKSRFEILLETEMLFGVENGN